MFRRLFKQDVDIFTASKIVIDSEEQGGRSVFFLKLFKSARSKEAAEVFENLIRLETSSDILQLDFNSENAGFPNLQEMEFVYSESVEVIIEEIESPETGKGIKATVG